MTFPKIILAAAVTGGISMTSYNVASAAPLIADSAAMPTFRGSQPFSATLGPLTMFATVEYAVYAPGAYGTSTALNNPTDPSSGTQYVYAYKMTNSGSGTNRALGELSVGLDGSTNSANIGVVSGAPFGTNPDHSNFIPVSAPFSSAAWVYDTELTIGQNSNILIFTSPKAPHFYAASVLGGGLSSQQQLPSPIPEPTSIMMLSGLALLACKTLRPNRKN